MLDEYNLVSHSRRHLRDMPFAGYLIACSSYKLAVNLAALARFAFDA